MTQRDPVIVSSLFFFLLATFTFSVWGQANDSEKKVVVAMDVAFKSWLNTNEIKDGALVVMRDDRVIGTFANGERTADLPVTVASLTKASTGACIAQLIDTDKLQLQDKLVDLLKKEFKPLGRTYSTRNDFEQIKNSGFAHIQ